MSDSNVANPDGGHDHFARFTLDGPRFEGARLPIDALLELQRYRQLILESARQAWRTANPEIPVPDDFSRAFDLAISDVEVGSATPVLDKPDTPYDQYYERGRDAFEAAFARIINDNFSSVDDALDEVEAAALSQTELEDFDAVPIALASPVVAVGS